MLLISVSKKLENVAINAALRLPVAMALLLIFDFIFICFYCWHCLVVWNLSCWQTNKQTNKQTNTDHENIQCSLLCYDVR